MRSLSLFLVLSLSLFGCGDDSGDGTDGGGASGSGGSGSGGSGAGAPVEDNGCGEDGYMAATEIAFSGVTYTPRCAKIAAGGTVTWSGDFVAHPLQGGVVEGSMMTPDDSSPIQDAPAGAMEHTVTFAAAGTYPFYCTIHGGVGMNGAVLVE
jgi:plastocyanin